MVPGPLAVSSTERTRMSYFPRAARSLGALGALVALVITGASCSSGSSSDSTGAADPGGAALVAADVARAAGIDRATETHGENCVADFDDDGTLDLLLSTHASGSEPPAWPLMRGLPDGRFERDERFQLEVTDRHGCAVADFNGDGLLDIYFSVGGCRGECEGPKELWIQQADHTFVNEAAKWGIDDPGGRGRAPTVLNANGDDLPDLFTGQEKAVKFPSRNRLWINRGDHFELQKGPQTNDLENLCSAAADIDGNGLDEIAMCTTMDGFFIYRNDDGEFVEATEELGVDDYGRLTAEFADLNDDDRPDLVTVAPKRVQVHLNEGGRYGDVIDLPISDPGTDVAIGDVDGDGDQDIYVQMRTRDRDQVFLNSGDGRRFTPGPRLPRAQGVGDKVVAIPNWKGTGRAAFVVNNGFQETVAPRQLFEFSG